MTNYASHGTMLMCLAQLVDDKMDPAYTETMQRLSNKMHTLLDNGANEGDALSNEALVEAAGFLNTSEMVLPDVLGDAAGTWETSIKFLKGHARPYMNYMGVVQGTTEAELRTMVDQYATEPIIKVLGLPRLLLSRFDLKSVRIDFANWIDMIYHGRFQIHFLGGSSIWPKEPYYANKYCPGIVRSIDTSLPFNYGLAGVVIEQAGKAIDRPKDYFTKWHVMTDKTSIMHNVNVYKEWCSGKAAPFSQLS
jgi:hypothetical protein